MHKKFYNEFGCESYLQDKYFQGLYCYNKNQISHKSHFYGDIVPNKCSDKEKKQLISKEIKKYEKFLTLLNFNLSQSNSNFKFARRYYSDMSRDFSWQSSNEEKVFLEKYFDIETRQYIRVQHQYPFGYMDLQNHLLSHLKKRTIPGFVRKIESEDRNELTTTFRESMVNINKINNKTIGATQVINSNILWLDIDNTDKSTAIESLNNFCDYFDITIDEFMFIEQNYFTGGIHAFLKLPVIIVNNEFYSNLEKYFKENGMDIECNFQNKVLRLPLSFEYNSIIKSEAIRESEEFIDEKFFMKSWEDINVTKIYKPVRSEKLLKVINEFNVCKKVNYWDTTVVRFNKSKTSHYQEVYEINEGERWDKVGKIVPYLKARGYKLDEVVDEIISHNNGSKDLTKWDRKQVYDSISSFYKKCDLTIDNQISLSKNRFISNECHLSDNSKSFLENKLFIRFFADKVMENYLKERNKHKNSFKKFSNEKQAILYQELPYYLKEIIGSMYYFVNNKKEVKDINLSQYLGYQLSDEQFKSIEDNIISKLNLEDNKLAKSSTQYMKKAILRSLGLEEINLTTCKRNWLNGFCKCFNVKSLKDVNDVLEHLFRSFNSKDIISKFIKEKNLFSKNFISNILYILLQEKQIGLSENCLYDLITGEILDEIPKYPI